MMTLADEADWPRDRIDADYTARACVTPQAFDRIITDYLNHSAPARDLRNTTLGIPFDNGSPETLDIYAATRNAPVFLFIHGGYWRGLSKEHSAFMAATLAAQGIATAVPNYTLSPKASLSEITRQMRAAFAHLWHNAGRLGIDRNRIVVSGSSAGGHLAAMLAMPGWQSGFDLPDDAVHACLPVSGLFELAPIAASHVQDWLSLSGPEIVALSPLRHTSGTARSHIALAQTEAAGFTRQSAAYAQALGAPLLTIPGRNHFDVVLDLMDENTTLSQALLALFND